MRLKKDIIIVLVITIFIILLETITNYTTKKLSR